MITRERLRQLLGVTDGALRFAGAAAPEAMGGFVLERLAFETPEGKRVRGLLTRPAGARGAVPAILYAHAHGGDFDLGADELLRGRSALFSPLAPVFAAEGYAALAIDMSTFGTRRVPAESAAAKAAQWYGRSLIGQMAAEQIAGIDYLASRPDIDAGRLFGFGLSMGATLTCWVAALDTRIAAAAHLCCFADLRTMVALGAHDGHGHYMTVPGLLAETDNGGIAGLIAPRPQLVCLGADDPLTPPAAAERAVAEARAAYAGHGAHHFDVFVQHGVGHAETSEMRTRVLDFFRAQR